MKFLIGASVASLALAVPQQQRVPTSVPIHRHKSLQSAIERAAVGSQNTIARYLQKVHPNAARQSFGQVSLTNEEDQLYVAPVQFGDGQLFYLDLDTGSSDTWVRGVQCTSSDGSCFEGRTGVNTADSLIKSLGKTWSVTYGSGKAAGTIYTGSVSIGGGSAVIPFGIASNLAGFNITLFDGLMGLGYDSISQISKAVGYSASYFDGLKLVGDSNRFAFYFSNSIDKEDGEVTFGGENTARYTGPITWIPLNSKTYWQFGLAGASVTVGSVKTVMSGNAIADTGTTLVIMQTKPSDAVNNAIGARAYDPSQGIHPMDCSIAATGPLIEFTLNGTPFSIPASVYVFVNAPGDCFSGFTRGAGFFTPTIFGDVFLRQYYSIYDKAQGRVGFATAVHVAV